LKLLSSTFVLSGKKTHSQFDGSRGELAELMKDGVKIRTREGKTWVVSEPSIPLKTGKFAEARCSDSLSSGDAGLNYSREGPQTNLISR